MRVKSIQRDRDYKLVSKSPIQAHKNLEGWEHSCAVTTLSAFKQAISTNQLPVPVSSPNLLRRIESLWFGPLSRLQASVHFVTSPASLPELPTSRHDLISDSS